MKDNSPVFTRSRYLALTYATEPVIVERSNREFDAITGTAKQLDSTIVASDIEALDEAMAEVKEFVDQRSRTSTESGRPRG